ncbi:MAG: sugar ABC transporter substrate-binding protein [Treponema sp.]|jgi:multiple sugar transport system substrate-binding protein|nr:sugar ABC transporter substrate-binding protein [Treponema sp.]
MKSVKTRAIILRRGFLAALLFILAIPFCFAKGKTDAAASPGKTVISFDQFSGSGDNEVYLKQMIDLYTRANPNVEIKLQSYGYDDYFMQLTAKIAAGQAADVFELNYENFVAYAGRGSLLPLDNIITQAGINTAVYNQKALEAFSANGRQFGVPNSFSNVVLFYNKELFDRAGIAYPTDNWTWADAQAAAKKIRALGPNIFGYFHPLSFTEFYKTAVQNGGSLLSQDGKQWTINTPSNIETVTYLVGLQRDSNVMPTPEQLAGMGDWDLFKSGRLGMLVNGIWAFPDFTRDCDFAWDIVVEPGNKQKATHFFSNGYAINPNSTIPVEAAKFIAFISSDRQAAQIRVDSGWELPPVIDNAIIASYKTKTPPSNREAVFKSLDYLVTPPVITQFTQLQDIVAKHLNEAAAGRVTPAEALANMEAECKRVIDLSK